MRILYVAPAQGQRGGVADYAERFREALDVAGVVREDVGVQATTPSRSEVGRIHRRVAADAAAGRFAGLQAAHVELSANGHREFEHARALARHTELPLVLTLHEPATIVARPLKPLGGRVVPRLLEPVGGRRKRALLRAARSAVVLGPAAQAAFEARWDAVGQVRVIRHVGFPGPRADPSAPGRVRVLYAGFFGPGKGLDVLLEALARVYAVLPPDLHPTLVVAGAEFAPGARDPIGELVAAHPALWARIERTGYLERPAFERLFASCHVGVVPYRDAVPGGASGIVMRCLSAGLATVCSDTPALRQEVEDGRTGVLVPAGDPDALAAALERLVRHADLRGRLGAAAADRVAAERSLERIGASARAVYEDVAGAPG